MVEGNEKRGPWSPVTFEITLLHPLHHADIAQRSIFSLLSFFSPPCTLSEPFWPFSYVVGFHSSLLPRYPLPPARWKSHRYPTGTSSLICQKLFSSHLPLPINLDKQGRWASILEPKQDTGKSRAGPSRSSRPYSQRCTMSVSMGKLRRSFFSKGLSRDPETRHETTSRTAKQASREAARGN